MDNKSAYDRRNFIKLGTLAATAAAAIPASSRAAATTTGHALPKLPYGYDALAPHIDARTMEIHHSRHHAGYVKKLNAALEGQAGLARLPLADLQAAISGIGDESLRTAVRNNGGGHWNHDFFWKSMTPPGQIAPAAADVMIAIKEAFGGFDEFKKAFTAAATSRFGSGWAWLIVRDGKLAITSTPNQDNPLMKGIVPEGESGIPILGIDVWEHAYYLHYQNRRGDYLDAWWNVVNWIEVSKRLAAVGV